MILAIHACLSTWEVKCHVGLDTGLPRSVFFAWIAANAWWSTQSWLVDNSLAFTNLSPKQKVNVCLLVKAWKVALFGIGTRHLLIFYFCADNRGTANLFCLMFDGHMHIQNRISSWLPELLQHQRNFVAIVTREREQVQSNGDLSLH